MAALTFDLKYVPALLLAAGACAAAYTAAAYAAGDAPAAVSAPANLVPEKNPCSTRSEPVAIGSVQWNGWGRGLDNTRYQSEPGLRASDVAKLALKWSYGYQGSGAGSDFGARRRRSPTI